MKLPGSLLKAGGGDVYSALFLAGGGTGPDHEACMTVQTNGRGKAEKGEKQNQQQSQYLEHQQIRRRGSEYVQQPPCPRPVARRCRQ